VVPAVKVVNPYAPGSVRTGLLLGGSPSECGSWDGMSYTLVTEWVSCATILQVDLQDVARPICDAYLLLEGISSGRHRVDAGNNQMELPRRLANRSPQTIRNEREREDFESRFATCRLTCLY